MLLTRIREGYEKSEHSRRTLRRFGLVGGVALLALSIAVLSYNWIVGGVLVVTALVTILLAELNPDALLGPHRFWFRLRFLLGAILTPVILGAIYLFVVTPIGVLRRVRGFRDLDLRFKSGHNSYWQPRLPSKVKNGYEGQF